MSLLPEYGEGHLVVAAIRVLEVQLRRPPDAAEIGGLIGWPPERVGLVTRGLEAAGVLRGIEHAFEHRLEIVDHLKLEQLPRDQKESVFVSEMEEFAQRSQQEQDQLTRMFETGEHEHEKSKKIKNLDDEFGRFQQRKRRNPFGGA